LEVFLMRSFAVAIAVLALATSQSGFAKAADQTASVTMKAQNGSGEDGTATLTQTGADLTVTISIPSGPTTPQPAHIHMGSCATLGGVKYPLTNVVSGKSTTTLKDVSLASVETGGFAINVHKSASDLGTYVSCGDIPKM
jgi:CHRD domain-containing protein